MTENATDPAVHAGLEIAKVPKNIYWKLGPEIKSNKFIRHYSKRSDFFNSALKLKF
jgi:hypothetical protein